MIGVLAKATGMDIGTLTHELLTGPAGMRDTKWAPRPWSRGNDAANSIGLVTSARDLARFGLLILAKGEWNREDLLNNPAYFRNMLSPSQNLNPSYGLLWWLNGQERAMRGARGRGRAGSMIPGAPDDLVAAQGALGRKCYVVPSMKLVVTRLGDEPGDAFNEEFWALLMKAAPEGPRSEN
jgi:CubicO group peptidase (beta-lactamase class C family)